MTPSGPELELDRNHQNGSSETENQLSPRKHKQPTTSKINDFELIDQELEFEKDPHPLQSKVDEIY